MRVGKLFGLVLVGVLVGWGLVGMATSCSPRDKALVRTLVDVLLAECVVEHAGEPEVDVMRACRATPEDAPAVSRLLAAHARAGARGRDGGAR